MKNKKPLGEQAYQSLYQQIVTMELKPGAHLDERDLIERLNLGRTPIREALLRLSSENLLENLPNKGFAVRPITLQNTKAMFQALWFMESAVIQLASSQGVDENIDRMEKANAAIKEAVTAGDPWLLVKQNNEYHLAFARCSGNEYIIRALKDVRFESARLAYLSFSHESLQGEGLSQHYQTVVEEHEAMIKALHLMDKKALEHLTKDHLHAFQQRIVSYLTSFST